MIESRWKAPALSGAILGLSYCFPLFVTNFVAFVPLLLWTAARADGRAGFWRAGLLFGLVTHLITLHWIYVLAAWTWLAWLLYLLFAVLLALRIMLTVRLLGALRARRPGLPFALLLPTAWIPLEWLQSFGDLRMTGEHLAHTLSRYPWFVQFADLAGPYGVTAAMLAINGLVADLWLAPAGSARRRRCVAALVALVAAIGVYDAWRWWTPPGPGGGMLRVGFVQPDVPLDAKMQSDKTAEEQLAILTDLSRRAAAEGAELILWPESARPYPVYHWLDRPDTRSMPEVSTLARELDAAFLVGVEYLRIRTRDDYELYNAALAVERDGRVVDGWAAKKYLVPFVEQMPYRDWVGPWLEGKDGTWRWLMGAFEPGPQAVLEVADTRIGVLVCYEQLFADLANELNRNGAQMQVVITNDAWFGRTLFQQYQANALRLRAIENRRAIVRVANTGISGFVDRRGRYADRTALFEEAWAVRDVRRADGPTPFNRIGNLVAWLTAALLAGLLVAGRFRPRRNRRGGRPPQETGGSR